MKDFARPLYHSQQWKKCREQYLRKVGGLCECCLKQGIYRPATIVHHKIFITPDNWRDPEISLNPANLMAVCRSCHEAIHNNQIFLPKSESNRRYTFGPDGSVQIK